MSKGIEIPFISDVARWLKGTRSVEDSLDDVADSLDDLARETAKSSDKAAGSISDGFKGAAKDASGAADKIETDYRDALRQVSSKADDTGKDIATKITRGTEDASEGTRTFKENAASNAKEAAASFQDVGSVLDGIQGLAAEALEGFGPAGIVAGVGVAAAFGAITQSLQAAADKANELTTNAAQLATDMAGSDTGARIQMLADRWTEVGNAIADARSVWEVWQPRAVTNIERFAAAAKYGQINITDMFDAFNQTDPTQRLKDLTTLLTSARKAQEDLTASTMDGHEASKAELATFRDRYNAINSVVAALQDEVNTQQAANDIATARAAAAGQTVEAYQAEQDAIAAAKDAQDAYRAAVAGTADPADVMNTVLANNTEKVHAWAQAQADATKSTKDTWEDYATEVTATLDDVLAELDSRVQAEQQFQANLAALGARGYGALAESLRAGGPAANGSVVALLAAGTDAQVQSYANSQGYLTGQNLGKGAATGVASSQAVLQEAITRTVSGLSLPVLQFRAQLDSGQVNDEIARLSRTPGTIEFKARIGQQGVM